MVVHESTLKPFALSSRLAFGSLRTLLLFRLAFTLNELKVYGPERDLLRGSVVQRDSDRQLIFAFFLISTKHNAFAAAETLLSNTNPATSKRRSSSARVLS